MRSTVTVTFPYHDFQPSPSPCKVPHLHLPPCHNLQPSPVLSFAPAASLRPYLSTHTVTPPQIFTTGLPRTLALISHLFHDPVSRLSTSTPGHAPRCARRNLTRCFVRPLDSKSGFFCSRATCHRSRPLLPLTLANQQPHEMQPSYTPVSVLAR